jgi:hypothetical protein
VKKTATQPMIHQAAEHSQSNDKPSISVESGQTYILELFGMPVTPLTVPAERPLRFEGGQHEGEGDSENKALKASRRSSV